MIPLAFLRGVPWQVYATVAVLAVAGLYHWRAVSVAYEAGKTEATRAIEAANTAAKDKADEGIKDVDSCFAAGGAWSRARGVCIGASK
jgi:hypothetical protein